jgi:C1A family cysteine protease
MSDRIYGYHPSLSDHRDRPVDYGSLPVKTPAPEIDPRDKMQTPYDQGQLGSCTANAVAGAVEYDALLDGNDFGTPSRLFIYYEERVIEGTVNSDAGAVGRDGFKVVKRTGVPPEADWPYVISRFKDHPPTSAYQDANQHKIPEYTHVPRDPYAWKVVLSNQQTIALGFSVYESFESNTFARSGIMPFPKSGERLLGGHEVLAIGYLEQYPDYVLCRNSWGTGWGLEGYFFMPWSYITDARRFSSDFRTIPRPA